jgi:hypothetical protein
MKRNSFKEFLNEYKKREENKIIVGLKDMERQMNDLKPIVDEYYKIQRDYNLKKKEYDKQKKWENLVKLKRETSYVECTYPEMGTESSNGSVFFEDDQQANNLLNALRSNASYYYAYIIEWSGKGKYIVEPDWKYDHDGEIVYTATIKKDN